jgi:hypothetical protein
MGIGEVGLGFWEVEEKWGEMDLRGGQMGRSCGLWDFRALRVVTA